MRRMFYEKFLFPNLRILLTKTQYSSDITSNVWIYRFTLDITRGDFNKIEGGPLGDKKNSKKVSQRPLKDLLVFRFCLLRLKSEK